MLKMRLALISLLIRFITIFFLDIISGILPIILILFGRAICHHWKLGTRFQMSSFLQYSGIPASELANELDKGPLKIKSALPLQLQYLGGTSP